MRGTALAPAFEDELNWWVETHHPVDPVNAGPVASRLVEVSAPGSRSLVIAYKDVLVTSGVRGDLDVLARRLSQHATA